MTYQLQKNYIFRKQLVTLAIFILIMSAIALLIVPSFPKAQPQPQEEVSVEDAALETAVAVQVYKLFTETSTELMSLIDGTSENDGLNGIVSSVSLVLKMVASVLILIYFIVAIGQETSSGNSTKDMWLKMAVKFVITCALIAYGDVICTGISKFAALLVDGFITLMRNTIGEATNAQLNEYLDTLKAIADGTVASAESEFSFNALGKPFFVMYALIFYVKIQKYSIILELILREALFPLASVTVINDGLRSPAVRFFKKYLAIYVRMAMMFFTLFIGLSIAMLYISGQLNTGTSHELSGVNMASYDVIAIFSACAVLIGKGNKIANQVVGVE